MSKSMRFLVAVLFALLAPTLAVAQGPGGPGPGPTPQPWGVNSPNLFYDLGGITLPQAVPGGPKGIGTINVEGLYLNGVPFLGGISAITAPLALSAGTLSLSYGGAFALSSGILEEVLPVQTFVAANHTFVAGDLYKETRRSNFGLAMADTFPAAATASLVNGTRVQLNNVDTTGSDTLSPGAGTTISGSGIVGPGRSTQWVYDAPNTTWRPTMNSLTALLGPSTATPGHVATYADSTGKVVQDGGIAIPGVGSSTVGDLAVWNNTLGSLLSDVPFSTAMAPSAPTVTLTAPSSPGAPSWTGSGCNYGTALPGHTVPWTDQNWCLHQYNASILGDEPSAFSTFQLGGSVSHVGEQICQTFSFTNGGVSQNVCYTVQGGDTLTSIASAIISAITANSSLYTSPNGGYNSGAPIAYVQFCGAACFTIDYNSKYRAIWSYTVSGGGAETITAESGWSAGEVNNAGTTGGAANAQTLSVSSFRAHNGESVTFTAGVTNTASTNLTINALSPFTVKKYVNGVLTNLGAGDLTSGTSYIAAFDGGSNLILGYNATYQNNGSAKSTFYQLPNALDGTFIHFEQRTSTTGTQANGYNSPGFAPGSALWDLTVGCNNSAATSTFVSNVNCGIFALFGINSTPGGINTAWFFSTASNGSGFFIGNGIWANGGCATNFAPGGCGLFEEGAGSININTYWASNVKFADGAGQLYNLGTALVSTGPTAWTPTDGSGAALAFTAVSASWSRNNNMVYAYGTLTYPATADATVAKVTGLPITVPNQSYAAQCNLTYSTSANATKAVPIKNTTNFNLASAAGSAATNAQLSGVQLVFECVYPAS